MVGTWRFAGTASRLKWRVRSQNPPRLKARAKNGVAKTQSRNAVSAAAMAQKNG